MTAFFEKVKQDYLDTRSTPQEDFLYWFIQRKMTWGQRWILVILLTVLLQPLFLNLNFLLWVFRLGLALYIFYILGHAYFFLRSLIDNKHPKIDKIKKADTGN